jgi:hypothetical protein
VFQRGSNVLEYWLDHAEGFEVRFRRGVRGHVESVVVDPASGRAQGLVVRKARTRRTRVIPAQSIVAVDPFAEVLVTRRSERSSPARFASALASIAVATWLRGRARAHALGPRIAAAISFGSARVVAAAAWVSPRAWRLARVGSARFAAGARHGASRLARATRTSWGWLRPRVAAYARAAGSSVETWALGPRPEPPDRTR